MARVTLRGRASEMSAVLGALRQCARTGRAAVVAMVGEPGIGKTSVLGAAAEQARRQGFSVGVGKSEEIDQIASGAPLLVAVRSGSPPLFDATEFAELAALHDQPLWLVDRMAELLAGRAAHEPVLIGLDDVQWTDPLTRFALRLLPSRLAGLPVVWLLTSRLTPIDRLEEILAAAEPVVPVTRIELGPIADADIDILAADRLGAAPDESVLALIRGVGGNPFWTVQLLTGLTRRRAHGLPETGLHAELIAGIRQRTAALPDFVVSVVQAVAVVGRPLTAGAVAVLLDEATADLVHEAAEQAREEGMLTIEGGLLSLPHDLIREAVYAQIPAAERTRLHRARGRQLTLGRTALPAAPHFLASAGPDDLEAVDVTLRAAAESVSLSPAQAGALAREAFDLLRPGHPEALEIGERALAVLVDAQRSSDVLDLADALLPIADSAGAVARIEIAACRALWETGAGQELEHRAGSALARADLPEVDRARLRALQALGSTRTPSAPASAAAANDALAEGRRLGDRLTQRTALLALTEATRNRGEFAKVLGYFDQLRVVSPGTHVAERIRTLQHLDRYDEAAVLLARARHEVGDNLERLLPSYLFAQVWQHHNLGELGAAETIARMLLRQAEAVENFAYVLNARIILCGLAIYRGDLDRAQEALAAVEDAAELQEPIRVSRLLAAQAWLAGERGDLERSLRIIGPLLATADDGSYAWAWSPGWMRAFAGIARQAGDADALRRVTRLADLGARRNPGVATMTGLALQVRGHLTSNAAVLHRAVTVMRGSPRPLLTANAIRDLGEVLVTAGRRDDARLALREARDLYERIGALGHARAVEQQHPALGTAHPTRARQGWAALTESEARVAELVAAGHSNRSAAAVLGVSTNTISTHLRSVFAKFDVRSRVQLANAMRTR